MVKEHLLKGIIKVAKKKDVQKLILFGSYARGDQSVDSDIDLLVIKDIPESKTRDFRIDFKSELWLQLGKYNRAFDVLVDSEDRIRERILSGDLFFKEIITNGQLIYAQ